MQQTLVRLILDRPRASFPSVCLPLSFSPLPPLPPLLLQFGCCCCCLLPEELLDSNHRHSSSSICLLCVSTAMNCSFFLGGFLTFLFIWLLIYEVRGLENDQGDFKVKAWLFFLFFFVNYYHHDYYYHLFIYSDGLAGPLILCQFAGSNRWADND